MAVSATGILTIGRVKGYLQVTEHSTILEKIVDGVCEQIEREIGRRIRAQDFSELYPRPTGAPYIILNQPNVTEVKGVFVDTFEAFRARYTGSDSVARLEVRSSEVTLFSRLEGTETETSVDYATYAGVSRIVTQIDAQTGWDATLVQDGPSAYLMRMGNRNAKNTWLSVESWEDYDGDYEVDYDAGIINFPQFECAWSGSLNNFVRIDYAAGHVTVPPDVELFALEAMQEAWLKRSTDTSVHSESEGDYSVTYRVPDFTMQIRERLSTHRRWTA